jgi:hypothetical protein
VRPGEVAGTVAAEPTELMPDMQPFPVVPVNRPDDSGPSATVADTLPLPPKLFDAIRSVCHHCHPLSVAISITEPAGN